MPLETRLAEILEEVRVEKGNVLVLTGAGISAESGIPTFRGAEGYWTIGSQNYMPMEMATRRMFDAHPDESWRWYMYRFGVCRTAEPNAGHRAIAELEEHLGDRFTLVTQNIDGLHRRAGNTSRRTYCIHGDAGTVRCATGCGVAPLPVPDLGGWRRDHEQPLTAEERRALTCPRCGGWLRPHVLWFDETYDEENFRWDSTIRAIDRASLLLVVGTSGATTLPMVVGERAARRRIAMVDVNPARSPFSDLAETSPRGFFARGTACERLPEIACALATGSAGGSS